MNLSLKYATHNPSILDQPLRRDLDPGTQCFAAFLEPVAIRLSRRSPSPSARSAPAPTSRCSAGISDRSRAWYRSAGTQEGSSVHPRRTRSTSPPGGDEDLNRFHRQPAHPPAEESPPLEPPARAKPRFLRSLARGTTFPTSTHPPDARTRDFSPHRPKSRGSPLRP